MAREKSFIYAARVVSIIFTPFYLPLLGLAVLFSFSYLNMLNLFYRLEVLLLVYFFTILLPTFLIHLYRRSQGWSLSELSQKRRRLVPYAISIVCYLTCIFIMRRLHVYHFVPSILAAALLIQMVCALINVWWKISTHMAGIGGVLGALIIFSELFTFNPVWWVCLVLMLAGVLGSARMLLRQHSLAQVLCGFAVGLVCAFIGIIYPSLI